MCRKSYASHRTCRTDYSKEKDPSPFVLRSSWGPADKARPVLIHVSFFVVCFCSPFLLLVLLDSAQNTKGIEMQMTINQ